MIAILLLASDAVARVMSLTNKEIKFALIIIVRSVYAMNTVGQ